MRAPDKDAGHQKECIASKNVGFGETGKLVVVRRELVVHASRQVGDLHIVTTDETINEQLGLVLGPSHPLGPVHGQHDAETLCHPPISKLRVFP